MPVMSANPSGAVDAVAASPMLTLAFTAVVRALAQEVDLISETGDTVTVGYGFYSGAWKDHVGPDG